MKRALQLTLISLLLLPNYGFSQIPVKSRGSKSEKFVVEGKFINAVHVKCYIYIDVNNEWIFKRSEIFNRHYKVSLSSFNTHLIVFENDTYYKSLYIIAEQPVTVLLNPDFRTGKHSIISYNEERGIYMFKVFTEEELKPEKKSKDENPFMPIETKEEELDTWG